MRNKERIAILNDCVSELTDSVKKLKQDVKQLNCKHDGDVEFYTGFIAFNKICCACGKVLAIYYNHNEFFLAEAKHIKDMADKAKKEADENYKKVKDEQ